MTALPTPIVTAEALAGRPDVRVLDARSGPDARDRYLAGHVAGALHVDLERDLSGDTSHPERGGRHPLPSIEAWTRTLGRLGITPRTAVAIYDDKGGANAAARCWWMLRAVGHEAVAVVDGGLAAAEEAGLPMRTGDESVDAAPPYPAGAWTLPTRSIEDVDRLRSDPSHRLFDVRAPERYRGEAEPLDPVAGHIPGAHNVPLNENLDEHGRFLSADALRERYGRALGDVPPERAILSCGSGVTACHALLALERAGMPGASLFVGSWSEWCRSGREGAEGPKP